MLDTAVEINVTPDTYQVSPFPLGSKEANTYSVYIKAVKPGVFAVSDGGLEWVSRDGEWINNNIGRRDNPNFAELYHFTFDEAVEVAKKEVMKVKRRGITTVDAIQMQSMSADERTEFRSRRYQQQRVEELREKFGPIPVPSHADSSEKFASLDKGSDVIAYILSTGERRTLTVHTIAAQVLLWPYSAVNKAAKFGENSGKFTSNMVEMTMDLV